ncbi:MAG: D-sedoheptulose 7-phosphate isomerase [Bacteroidetes bacterium]|nr:D-sedoheptulose 7-phosphate isomerase [Bacteroidota bacterium]
MDFKNYFHESQTILNQFISDEENFNNLHQAGALMVGAINAGNKIFSCGNGGSMSDAMHFAEELSGRFRNDRRALPAIAIADPTHITCTANDYGYKYIFSRYLEALGKEGDVLLAISTSGNSENVVEAAIRAKEMGIKVIALTGKDGGKLALLADVEIRSPHSQFSDHAQEIHIKIIHALIGWIEANI